MRIWNDTYIRREDKYVDMDCDSDAEGGKGGRILRKRTLHGISPSYVPEQTVHEWLSFPSPSPPLQLGLRDILSPTNE